VITYINAVPVNTCAELAAYLATRKPGDRVVVKVHREDRDFLLTLEIEE
jgi:S1-C subfamily serine protease